jgi:hypothetical protein
MPFVLRRTKQQVLKDLPPKIITDVYCDLTPLQRQLYEDFAATPAATSAAGALRSAAGGGGGGGLEESSSGGGGGGGGAATHVFQALAYLRKLCSHPLLVLDWNSPEHRAAASERLGARSAADAASALSCAEAAPKLLALRDLLFQCGIAAAEDEGGARARGGDDGGDDDAADGGHRLLVFAQLKATLDFVESQLLAPLGVRRPLPAAGRAQAWACVAPRVLFSLATSPAKALAPVRHTPATPPPTSRRPAPGHFRPPSPRPAPLLTTNRSASCGWTAPWMQGTASRSYSDSTRTPPFRWGYIAWAAAQSRLVTSPVGPPPRRVRACRRRPGVAAHRSTSPTPPRWTYTPQPPPASALLPAAAASRPDLPPLPKPQPRARCCC